MYPCTQYIILIVVDSTACQLYIGVANRGVVLKFVPPGSVASRRRLHACIPAESVYILIPSLQYALLDTSY